MPYLSASAVVIHYEEVLYQVYAPLPLPLHNYDVTRSLGVLNTVWDKKIVILDHCLGIVCKWYNTDLQLLWITDRNICVLDRTTSFPVTLSDH